MTKVAYGVQMRS